MKDKHVYKNTFFFNLSEFYSILFTSWITLELSSIFLVLLLICSLRFFNAIFAFHISFRLTIYRSLISFAVSLPPHLVLHVILISSFITDVIAPPLRGATKRCNAFPSYVKRRISWSFREAYGWMVALVKQDGYYISFFTSSSLNVSLEVGILNYEFLINHQLEKQIRLRANRIHLSMNYL